MEGKELGPAGASQSSSATNDIGIFTLRDGQHLAVAAFVSDSAANDDTRDAIIASLAKAAWDRAKSLGR
jgi:beta-lactamase class A